MELWLIKENLKNLAALLKEEKGDFAEKAVLMAVIILGTLAALAFLASRIANLFQRVGSALQ